MKTAMIGFKETMKRIARRLGSICVQILLGATAISIAAFLTAQYVKLVRIFL